MQIEHRYFVAKVKDVDKYLTNEDKRMFGYLLNKIEDGRIADGKDRVLGMFIEEDWPEYEKALKMLSDRVDAEDANKA